jgi:hypothetical protein
LAPRRDAGWVPAVFLHSQEIRTDEKFSLDCQSCCDGVIEPSGTVSFPEMNLICFPKMTCRFIIPRKTKSLNFKLSGVAILLLLAAPGWAGQPEDTKIVVEPSPKPTAPWEIKVGAPAWLSFVTGDIGVHGITSHVDVGPNTILRHTNFIASLSGDVRRGRFGVTGDFLYLNGQDGTFTNGLTSKIDLHLEEFLGEFGVYWRMIEGPRGYLDALAGFRYTYTGTRLGLQANNQAIDTASTELVNRLAEQVATAASDVGALIRQTIDQRLTALRGRNPPLPVPPLAGTEPGSGSAVRTPLFKITSPSPKFSVYCPRSPKFCFNAFGQ